MSLFYHIICLFSTVVTIFPNLAGRQKARPQRLRPQRGGMRKASGGTNRRDESGNQRGKGATESRPKSRLKMLRLTGIIQVSRLFFCLWLVMWSNQNCQILSARKSAQSEKKSSVFRGKQRILWGYYPHLNRRPRPYQLISNPRNTTFRCFGGLFIPGNRRQWCFPLHCLRPLVSYCGSGCGSDAYASDRWR